MFEVVVLDLNILGQGLQSNILRLEFPYEVSHKLHVLDRLLSGLSIRLLRESWYIHKTSKNVHTIFLPNLYF